MKQHVTYFIKRSKQELQEMFKKAIEKSYKCHTVTENYDTGTLLYTDISEDDMAHKLVNEYTKCHLTWSKVLDTWILTSILEDTKKHSLILKCFISEITAHEIVETYKL